MTVRRLPMHPLMIHELARLKIAEDLEYAERQRRFRAARRQNGRAIDFSGLVGKLRVRFAGSPERPAPAGA
jgi:hypothetical protein